MTPYSNPPPRPKEKAKKYRVVTYVGQSVIDALTKDGRPYARIVAEVLDRWAGR